MWGEKGLPDIEILILNMEDSGAALAPHSIIIASNAQGSSS
jgi:hypothetical protein